MEAQNGRSVGGKKSADHYGSRNYTNMDVHRRLDQVGSKGKEHNAIVSLKFIISKYFRRNYNKGIMKQIRDFVSTYVPSEQIVPMEKTL